MFYVALYNLCIYCLIEMRFKIKKYMYIYSPILTSDFWKYPRYIPDISRSPINFPGRCGRCGRHLEHWVRVCHMEKNNLYDFGYGESAILIYHDGNQSDSMNQGILKPIGILMTTMPNTKMWHENLTFVCRFLLIKHTLMAWRNPLLIHHPLTWSWIQCGWVLSTTYKPTRCRPAFWWVKRKLKPQQYHFLRGDILPFVESDVVRSPHIFMLCYY